MRRTRQGARADSLPGCPLPPRAALVVLAGGEGRRVGHDTNKVLLPLAGRRVFTWSIRWARELAHVTHTVLVIREQDREVVLRTLDREVEGAPVQVVVGGDSRHGSEWSALQALAGPIERGEVDVVVIHDAARPLASTRLFEDVVAAAAEHGGALPVLTPAGLTTLAPAAEATASDVAAVTDGTVVAVQTPQAFAAGPAAGGVPLRRARRLRRHRHRELHRALHRPRDPLRAERRAQPEDHLPRGPVPRRAAPRQGRLRPQPSPRSAAHPRLDRILHRHRQEEPER